jgi:RNA polymerase sigma-70 factor (ECF subfamily)
MPSITRDFCKTARSAQNDFNKLVAPYRKDLFRFCRSLTTNPWDAEDLAQETLLKVYGRLGDTHFGIENPRAYLFRTASNLWVDWCRRKNQRPETISEAAFAAPAAKEFEVREAMIAVARALPPREQVAFVLKEVFDCSLEEIAGIVGGSEGSVKSALHRAREKVEGGRPSKALETKLEPAHEELVSKLVGAFQRRSIDEICQLFLSTASSSCYGCFSENSLEEIRKGSLFYTVNKPDGTPQPADYEGRVALLGGEPLFIHVVKGELADVWRFRIEDGKISHFDCYYTSPHVLEELARLLGLPAGNNGYYYEEGQA